MSAKKMNLTIAKAAKRFKWSNRTVKYLLNRYLLWTSRYDLWNVSLGNIERVATFVTVRDLFSELEKKFEDDGGNCYNHRRHKSVIRHFVRAGFTRVDSRVMPPHTLTAVILKKLSRKKLLACDATILYTLSPKELENQRAIWKVEEDGRRRRDWEKKKPRLKVRDILSMKPPDIGGKGAAQTITLLEKLGFGPKDGPFLAKENDPLKVVTDELIAKEGLSKVEARKIAEIAARRNWI